MGLPGSCRFCRPGSVEHPQSTEIGEVDRLPFLNLGRCVVAVASHQKFSKSYARSGPSRTLAVHGTTSDNGVVTEVLVNGQKAAASAPNLAQWTITLDATHLQNGRIEAYAIDAAHNVEKRPHVVSVQ